MAAERKYDDEYRAAPVKRVLNDAEYDRIYNAGRPALARLSRGERRDFFSTDKWHVDRRMSLDSLEGIVVGKMSFDEALAEADKNP